MMDEGDGGGDITGKWAHRITRSIGTVFLSMVIEGWAGDDYRDKFNDSSHFHQTISKKLWSWIWTKLKQSNNPTQKQQLWSLKNHHHLINKPQNVSLNLSIHWWWWWWYHSQLSPNEHKVPKKKEKCESSWQRNKICREEPERTGPDTNKQPELVCSAQPMDTGVHFCTPPQTAWSSSFLLSPPPTPPPQIVWTNRLPDDLAVWCSLSSH